MLIIEIAAGIILAVLILVFLPKLLSIAKVVGVLAIIMIFGGIVVVLGIEYTEEIPGFLGLVAFATILVVGMTWLEDPDVKKSTLYFLLLLRRIKERHLKITQERES